MEHTARPAGSRLAVDRTHEAPGCNAQLGFVALQMDKMSELNELCTLCGQCLCTFCRYIALL